jgi:hypothetical protein
MSRAAAAHSVRSWPADSSPPNQEPHATASVGRRLRLRRGAARQLLLVLLQLCLPSCALTHRRRHAPVWQRRSETAAECAVPSGEGGGGYDALHDHEGERIGMLPRQALEGDGHLGERQVVIARLDLCGKGGPSDVHCTPYNMPRTSRTTQRAARRPACAKGGKSDAIPNELDRSLQCGAFSAAGPTRAMRS